MKFSRALTDALSGVDRENWSSRLDALHGQHGSWKAVAGHLGVDKRTVERWRYGYTDKHGNRRQVADKTITGSAVPKISKGWKGDRTAQLRAVNWSGLHMRGTLRVGDYPARRQNMVVGHYLMAEDIERIGNAYLAGDMGRVDAAMDRFLAEGYTMTGDAHLSDVDKLEF